MKLSEYKKSEKHKNHLLKLAELHKTNYNIRIDNYNKNPRKCLQCNLPIPYGESKHKKFCDSSCAAKHNNAKKVNPGLKIKAGQESGRIDKICPSCGLMFKSMAFQVYCSKKCGKIIRSKTTKRKYEGVCETCKSHFYNVKRGIKTCSKECCRKLLRNKMMESVKNGTHKGWKSRSTQSYPEKYFSKILLDNNIQYEQEKKVGVYFIDFAIGKLALEIDGGQHEWPERKESDTIKDEFLSTMGYTVHRIKWHKINPKNEKSITLMKEKVDTLLELVKQFSK